MGDLSSQLEIVRQISNNFDNGVVIIDAEQKIVWLNDFLENKGFKLNDVKGAGFFETFGHSEFNFDKNSTLDSIKTGKAHKEIRKGGDGKEYEIESIPISYGEQVRYVVEISKDLVGENAEEIIKHDEGGYKTIFESVPDGILISDLKGVIKECNPAFEKITGFSKEEILNKHFTNLPTIIKKNLPSYVKSFADIIKGKLNGSIEFEWLHKDGSVCFGVANLGLLREKGKVKGVIIILNDLSEKNKSDGILKESEEKFKSIFETSPHGIISLDNKGIVTSWNKASENIFGWTAEETIGKFNPTVPKEMADFYLKSIPEKLVNIEIHSLKKDGSFVDILLSSTPTYDDKNQIIGALGVMTDITKIKNAEEKLVEGERRYDAIFNRSFDGVYVHDFKGDFIDANQAALDMLGYSKEEINSLNFSNLLSNKEQTSKAQEITNELLKTGVQRELSEFELKRKDGIVINVETKASVIYKNKKPFAVQGIVRDITKRKKAEEKLKESQIKLKNVIGHSNQLFYIHDTDNVLSYLSPQCKTLFGYIEEEMKVNWTTLATDNPINEKGIAITEEAIKTGEKQEPYLLELKKKDGSVFLGEVNESPLKDESGKVIGLVGSLRDVTEKIKSREKLTESEGRFKMILSTMPEGMDIVDEDLNIMYMNEKFLKIFGEDSIGKKCYEVYRDDKAQCTNCPLKSPIKVGDTKTIETSGVAGGREYEITHTGMVFEGKKAIMEVFRDVTEKNKSELALSESEERYKTLYETSADAIMTLEPPTWGFTSGNPATVKMFNTGTEEVFASLGPGDLSPEKQPDETPSADAAKKEIMLAMEKGSNLFNWTHKRYKGESFPATVLLTRIESEGKTFLQATVRDVSKEEKSEKSLLKEKEFSEKLLETAPGFIVSMDPKGTIVTFNKSAEDISGYLKKEVIGKNWFDIFVEPNIREKIRKVFSNVKIEKDAQYQNKIVIKNGEKKTVSWRNSTLKDEKGEVALVISVGLDVTQEIESEREKEKLTQELQKRVAELEGFQKITVGRELKMVELKKKIKELEEKVK